MSYCNTIKVKDMSISGDSQSSDKSIIQIQKQKTDHMTGISFLQGVLRDNVLEAAGSRENNKI